MRVRLRPQLNCFREKAAPIMQDAESREVNGPQTRFPFLLQQVPAQLSMSTCPCPVLTHRPSANRTRSCVPTSSKSFCKTRSRS